MPPKCDVAAVVCIIKLCDMGMDVAAVVSVIKLWDMGAEFAAVADVKLFFHVAGAVVPGDTSGAPGEDYAPAG